MASEGCSNQAAVVTHRLKMYKTALAWKAALKNSKSQMSPITSSMCFPDTSPHLRGQHSGFNGFYPHGPRHTHAYRFGHIKLSQYLTPKQIRLDSCRVVKLPNPTEYHPSRAHTS